MCNTAPGVSLTEVLQTSLVTWDAPGCFVNSLFFTGYSYTQSRQIICRSSAETAFSGFCKAWHGIRAFSLTRAVHTLIGCYTAVSVAGLHPSDLFPGRASLLTPPKGLPDSNTSPFSRKGFIWPFNSLNCLHYTPHFRDVREKQEKKSEGGGKVN